TRPKVFTLMGRRHWPNSRAMSTIRRCCEREPNGAAALQFEAQRIFFRRRRRIDDRLFAEVSRDDSSAPVEGLLAPVDLVAVVERDIKSAVMHDILDFGPPLVPGLRFPQFEEGVGQPIRSVVAVA